LYTIFYIHDEFHVYRSVKDFLENCISLVRELSTRQAEVKVIFTHASLRYGQRPVPLSFA